jgi:hypothetical protein
VQPEHLHEQLLDRVSVPVLPFERPVRVQLVLDCVLQLNGFGVDDSQLIRQRA